MNPFNIGTQLVTRKAVQNSNGGVAHPAGAVGIVIKAPTDLEQSYRIRFADGFEAALAREHLVPLGDFKREQLANDGSELSQDGLYERVILRCVIGSRAYGLDDEQSDTDRRGIYLPSADQHWALYGVPQQLENDATQEVYWELQKFITLALKANPDVLECLFTPLVEHATPLAQELLALRDAFLSKLVFQTYSGYVASQFKKMQGDLRNQGRLKWKHVMHLIRLLHSGIQVLEEGLVRVQVGEHREKLLAIKQGRVEWPEIDHWRLRLHAQLNDAFRRTSLPDRPDYERANRFLLKARRLALQDDPP